MLMMMRGEALQRWRRQRGRRKRKKRPPASTTMTRGVPTRWRWQAPIGGAVRREEGSQQSPRRPSGAVDGAHCLCLGYTFAARG